jgi:hypothetical protein
LAICLIPREGRDGCMDYTDDNLPVNALDNLFNSKGGEGWVHGWVHRGLDTLPY